MVCPAPPPDLGKWPEAGPMARSPILFPNPVSRAAVPRDTSSQTWNHPSPNKEADIRAEGRRRAQALGGHGLGCRLPSPGMGACPGPPGHWHLGTGTWALARTYFQLLPGTLAPYSRLGQVRLVSGVSFLSPKPGGEGQGGAPPENPAQPEASLGSMLPRTSHSPAS